MAERKVQTQERASFDAAYRATSYLVDGPVGRFPVRIGVSSPEADALTATHGTACWAYITAYNPGSVPAPAARNAERQRRLERLLTDSGYRFYPGEGRADDAGWPAEPSLFVVGMDETAAAALGRRFGQAAVVCGEQGRAARLVWTGVSC
ncbi:MAG TPA: DUF3293 domain-containing protein [Gemmataceae bacterium]|nr:DUF3293 domain-containing protein [Gemmataceae bacterium]